MNNSTFYSIINRFLPTITRITFAVAISAYDCCRWNISDLAWSIKLNRNVAEDRKQIRSECSACTHWLVHEYARLFVIVIRAMKCGYHRYIRVCYRIMCSHKHEHTHARERTIYDVSILHANVVLLAVSLTRSRSFDYRRRSCTHTHWAHRTGRPA